MKVTPKAKKRSKIESTFDYQTPEQTKQQTNPQKQFFELDDVFVENEIMTELKNNISESLFEKQWSFDTAGIPDGYDNQEHAHSFFKSTGKQQQYIDEILEPISKNKIAAVTFALGISATLLRLLKVKSYAINFDTSEPLNCFAVMRASIGFFADPYRVQIACDETIEDYRSISEELTDLPLITNLAQRQVSRTLLQFIKDSSFDNQAEVSNVFFTIINIQAQPEDIRGELAQSFLLFNKPFVGMPDETIFKILDALHANFALFGQVHTDVIKKHFTDNPKEFSAKFKAAKRLLSVISQKKSSARLIEIYAVGLLSCNFLIEHLEDKVVGEKIRMHLLSYWQEQILATKIRSEDGTPRSF